MINVIGDKEYLGLKWTKYLDAEEQDLCLIVPTLTDELSMFDAPLSEIELLSNFYQKLFDDIKKIADNMMKNKKGTIIFLFDSLVYCGNGGEYTPIKTNSLYSLMLSLSKELCAFNIDVFGIVLAFNPDNEYQNKLIKSKQMDMLGLKFKGIKAVEQMDMIKTLYEHSRIFRGQLISLGSALTIER